MEPANHPTAPRRDERRPAGRAPARSRYAGTAHAHADAPAPALARRTPGEGAR
ncbi:hypothetical protein [Kitasatospora herbaricolor]|uniref:hypothetical protein n=1 Tax=Kitasatospora herbaricolor TaxID=68217 RepID=UPI0036DAD1CB